MMIGYADIVGSLDALRRYARVLTRDETRAEDLVHDTLLRALERASSFREGENIGVWLRSILHNAFVDQLRRMRSESSRIDALASGTDEAIAPPQDASLQVQDLLRAFNALPDEQRSALYLVAVEDLSYAEAAASLGIPIGTLMSRIGRARAALRMESTELARGPSKPRLVSVRHG